MRWYKKWIKLIGASMLIIVIIVLFLAVDFSKPNEETIINILIDNITINGSDSNFISPYTGCPPHHVAIILRKEEIEEIKIIDSGYDFINRKYFCIFEIRAYSENEFFLTAKALMLLHYDNGWKLSEGIGVLRAHYEQAE